MIINEKNIYESFQSGKGGKFYPLYADLLDSKAFNSLSPNAVAIYIYLYTKYDIEVKDGIIVKSNHDNIKFTKNEIKQKRKEGYGIPSNNPSMAAIDELIEKGFLICKKSGYTTRSCNIYAFHDGWQTDDYIPEDKYKRSAKRDI